MFHCTLLSCIAAVSALFGGCKYTLHFIIPSKIVIMHYTMQSFTFAHVFAFFCSFIAAIR